MAKVAVIILNWNGAKLLQEFLPSVVAHTNVELGRIVVADNASDDASLKLLKSEFPEVDVIRLRRNFGFAGGYNRAIADLEEEIVVLLNSDVEVTPGWLEPLVELLEREPQLAAVQPKIKAYRRKSDFEYAGACGGFIDRLGFPFCRGRILNVTETDRRQYDDICEVFWCSGAALCIRKDVYLQMGGMDERFFAHMEEIDLCWRIRNAGWHLKVQPASVVYHLGGGSLPMKHPQKLFLNYRNNLLMLYKNLSQEDWRKISRQRWYLDMAAAVLFFLKGELANSKSIFRAYREFREMKSLYCVLGKERQDPCIYQGSILFKFYFSRVRYFSQLWK